jgi:hypothetical protein
LTRLLFFLFSLSAPCLSWCQLTNVLYPDLYTLYDANMYLVNTAYIPNDTRTDLSAFYKFQIGAFKEVSTLAFSAAKLYRRENESVHSLRLTVFNEKQGPYISSPRAYVNYGYELRLGEETRLAGGLAMGFAGMNYTGVSTTGDVNMLLPDASSGLIFKYKTLHLGAASQQLLNSKTKPFYSQIELRRHYHVHLSHELDLGLHWKWKYYALYRLLPATANELMVGTFLLYSQAIGLGVVMRSNSGISIYGEMALDSKNDRLKIVFNYNSNFFQLVPAFQNSIELGVGYVLK